MYRTVLHAVVFSGVATVLIFCGCTEAGEGTTRKPSRTPDCVYVGTPNDVAARMLEMAKITKDDVVIDPGCGDGRIIISAAKKYGCKAIGYEIDPKLVAEGQRLAKKRKVDDLVKIQEQDIFKADYSQANVIVMYLLPDMIVKLLPNLEDLKPGSRIVAHDYPIRGVAEDKSETLTSNEDNVKHTLYLYTVPLKKEKAE